MCRFCGQGVTCKGRSHRIVQQMQGRSNSLHVDPETEPISAITAAGNAALSRHMLYLRSRDLHPPHPAEGCKMTRTSGLPPKVSNTMRVAESVASVSHAADAEISGNLNVGAMLPADVDAIKINLTGPDVDVSSDDSTEDGTDSPAAL